MPEGERSFIRELFADLMAIISATTPMQIVALLVGLLTIGGMVWVIASGAAFFEHATKARGLITFSVAIVTVAIALIMVFYLVFGDGDKDQIKDRFTFGKDILMVFVGILGTIMGFYYAENKVGREELQSIASVVQKPAPSQALDPEKNALEALLKKDLEAAAKAFDDAYKATPTLPNIDNIDYIRKLLATKKDAFTKANDADKAKIWDDIFCDILNSKKTAGMTDEMKKTLEGNCKASPGPSPSLSPPAN